MSDLRGNVVGFPGGTPVPPGMAAGPPPGIGGPPPPPNMPSGMAGPPALPLRPGPLPPGPGSPAQGPGGPVPAPAGGAAPMPGLTPPGMMLNPAFVQWRQMAQAWHGETNRRRAQFLEACHTIRHDVRTGYAIDIEADSTIAPDEQAEKQSRTEFLQSIMPLMQMIIPEVQQNPQVAQLAAALVMFGVRAFPAARGLEEQFQQAFAALSQAPPTPPPDKGGGNVKTPMEVMTEARTAQGDQQVKQAQVQVQQQKNAIDLMKAYIAAQGDQAKLQQEGALHSAEISQQGEEMRNRAALEQARTTHLISRDIGGGGLV